MDAPRPGSGGSGGSAGASGSGGAGGMPGTGGMGGTAGMGGAAGRGGSGGMAGGAGGAGGAGMGGMAPDVAQPRDLPIAGDTAPAPGSKRVLLVVDNAASVNAAEDRYRQRLQAKMFTVIIGDDDDATADGRGVGMVVVPNSVNSGRIKDRFRDLPIPVICMEFNLYNDLRMTGTTATVDFDDETATQLTIIRPGHPMAAGLTGTLTVVTAATQLSWGKPGPAAEIVATTMGQPNHAAIWGYPAGAMMVGQVAPAKRVGLFVSDSAITKLNADGDKLFDAAIDWASR